MIRGWFFETSGTRLLLSALACIMLVGCSRGDRPPLAPVSGVVTLNGKPLAGVKVVFQPQTGHASMGITDQNGRYELIYIRDVKGAMLGKHRVEISKQSEEGAPDQLDSRYNTESTLTRVVKGDSNTFDFELCTQ